MDKTLHSSRSKRLPAPVLSVSARKQNPAMKIQNQCSNYSRRQQYVRGQARPVVGCGAMQHGWTRVPSPLPPCPLPVVCWGCAVVVTLPKQGAKRRENKNNTPAYTKVNKVIIKKTPLGSRHCWPRAPAAPGRPVRSRTLRSHRAQGGRPGRVPHRLLLSPCHRAGTPGWPRGEDSAPGSLRTSLLGKWTERRCASP